MSWLVRFVWAGALTPRERAALERVVERLRRRGYDFRVRCSEEWVGQTEEGERTYSCWIEHPDPYVRLYDVDRLIEELKRSKLLRWLVTTP